MWDHWNHLCEGSDDQGPHRLRISPYDPESRVWVVNETFHEIYVFSNDGSELIMTLSEKGVPGNDETHFQQPSDVLVAPDGSIFVVDGHGAGGNNRVVKFDSEGSYLMEWGST